MKLDSFAGDVLVAPGGGPTISVNMLQAVSLPAEVVPEFEKRHPPVLAFFWIEIRNAAIGKARHRWDQLG